MKRGSFRRLVPERKKTVHTPVPEHLRRKASYARADAANDPVIKDEAIRHEGYRRLVASLPCINCNKAGRSQHAHTNAGKAKGLKNDDRDAMPLCADEPGREGCHTKFDQYRLVPGGREAHVALGEEWSRRTRDLINEVGLWPDGLPQRV